ncbi:hypothetical protein AB0D99_24950 [Streptomyces sp. NPDC047971]|uniref:hypothetical protein n=1 Tax=Streptomyces sp. NPDC047971 TaxID=3154499 RepID=UPI0033F7B092
MSVHRRLGTAAGAALLTLAVAGCSGLGRTAVGPVIYETEREVVISVTSPSVNGCHRLAPSGVRAIENETLIDLKAYTNRNCQGDSIYVATNTSNRIAPDTLPWRSYSFVH